MNARNHLGSLQMAIMRILWERKEASAQEVHAALVEERGLAPTTIATMLKKMEDKGVVRHRTEGRRFLYAAKVEEEAIRKSMVRELVERLFLGDASALVGHLVQEGEVDTDELALLRQRVHEQRPEQEDE